MESALISYLWPIMMFGTIGAFIDFVIGRNGQIKIKDFLSRWWIRFDDVTWGNFGRKELEFAISVLDVIFGAKLFSRKRFYFCIGVLIASFIIIRSIRYIQNSHPLDNAWTIMAFVSVISMAINISCLKTVSRWLALTCSENVVRNMIVFIVAVAISYVFLVVWIPINVLFKLNLFGQLFGDNFPGYWDMLVPSAIEDMQNRIYPRGFLISTMEDFQIYFEFPYVDPIAFVNASAMYFPGTLRLGLSLVFAMSFLIQPLLIRPLSLLWLRVVESETPVFTLVLGGVGVLATGINEALKHLHL